MLLCCLAFALTIVTRTAAADAFASGLSVDPVGHSENYSAVLYDNTSGLPICEANDIVQTEEGFLWIASYAGLISYDGNSFERVVFNNSMKSVACLFVDSKGSLWIGSNDSGVSRLDRRGVKEWDEEDGLASDKTRGFAEDDKGNIYIGSTGGVAMMTPDEKIIRLEDPRIKGAMIDRVHRSADGLICCVTSDMDWFTIRDGEVVDFVHLTDVPVKNISGVVPDPDDAGKVMICTEDCGFYRGNIHGSAKDFEYVDTTPIFGVQEIKVFGEQIWLCGRNGIGVIDGEGFHNLDRLPLNNSVSHMTTDYKGNLWFSSTRQGIMKIVPNRFTDVFALCGLEKRVVNSTLISKGKLFIGTDTGIEIVKKNKPLKKYRLDSVKKASGEVTGDSDLIEMLDGCRIRSIKEDSRGRLWISTWGAHGLLCCDKRDVTVFDESAGMPSNYVRDVCEEEGGSMLAVCTGGIAVISDGRVTETYGKEEGLTNIECLYALTAPNGDRLVASNGAGIFIINGDGVRVINKKDGLESEVVMRIRHDPKRHLFWLVTGNSLAYMTEDYKVKTINSFPNYDNFDLFENSSSDIWVISGDGIYVMPASELLADKNINPAHYGLANGLQSEATANSFSYISDKGDLYICTRAGVTKVNINEPMEMVSDLKQSVPYIDTDGKRVYPDEKGRFVIPSDVKKLTIYPYVYNYSLTDPQVSYQLKGFDSNAVTVRRSELGPVSYTNLSGGTYTFVMELKDALGRGSKMLPVRISKEKAIYEQAWFYALCSITGILMLVLLIKRYVDRKMKALEKKNREEAELERVSSELRLAKRIQTGMLPHDFPPYPERDEFDIYASMDPARSVGGDFYDFFFVDEDHLCLVMADVSGKGIPAAMFMMNSKVMIQNIAGSGRSPGEILTRANETLCSNNETEMFVTVWLCMLDLKTGRVVAANAGHEYPSVRHSGEKYELYIDKHGLVLGGMKGIKYRDYELELAPGDSLFVYTDGVPEATSSNNEMFGTDRMLDALNSEPDADPEKILANVRKAVDDFVKDHEQFDDLTMLCIRYNGRGGS